MKVCMKIVLMNLTNDYLQQRREACDDLLQWIQENEERLNRVFSGDGSWVIQYNHDTKQQSV
jgi:hypothetical protein